MIKTPATHNFLKGGEAVSSYDLSRVSVAPGLISPNPSTLESLHQPHEGILL
jgi:hypothetical protein